MRYQNTITEGTIQFIITFTVKINVLFSDEDEEVTEITTIQN